uniref:Uncharacterized protein n=1 Tax=Rhizophora mucronata TaxID=61149 RepID=A0A2P2J332_RHIMU
MYSWKREVTESITFFQKGNPQSILWPYPHTMGRQP